MKKLLVAMLLLYPLSALAQTYEWTDRSGTVHFTEDLGKVPKKYRKKVKVIGDDTGEPRVTETTEPTKGKSAREAGGKEKEKEKKLYGGKDEAAWRNDFRNARRAVQQTESDLSDQTGRLADTSKMSRSEYLGIQSTIGFLKGRLAGQRQRLDQLQESADRAGVPAEFRQ
jgi:hypothetical protein